MNAGAEKAAKSGGCHVYTPRTPPVHRRSAAWGMLALTVLAACDTGVPEFPDAIPFRNPTVTLAGTTRFDPNRFAGEWFIVAQFEADIDTRRTYLFDPLNEVLLEREGDEEREYVVSGPGILEQVKPASEARLVVMWVDEGFRTAALGTAEGDRGVILDRKPEPAPDRLAAAIEVLDFNGWDTSRLVEISE